MYIDDDVLYDLRGKHSKAEGSHGKVYLLDGQAIKVSKDVDENIHYERDIFNQLQSEGIVQGKAEVVKVKVDKGKIVNALMTPWLEGEKPTLEQIIETLSSMKEAGYLMADPVAENFKFVHDKAVPIDFDKVFHKDNKLIPESILSGIIHDIDMAVKMLNNRALDLAEFYVQHKPEQRDRDNSIPSFLNDSKVDEYYQEESEESVIANAQKSDDMFAHLKPKRSESEASESEVLVEELKGLPRSTIRDIQKIDDPNLRSTIVTEFRKSGNQESLEKQILGAKKSMPPQPFTDSSISLNDQPSRSKQGGKCC
ncbi:hypothetical protein L3V82_10360 [Thiotrichales bacterium 19S3-7]|nr:hypothetical protein [Thiotrichales bacterium 19S3-7]MCF6802559.1 hypothetical protein [Thiotrichales bacterium 19S3-11]